MQNPLFDTFGPDDKYAITCPECGFHDYGVVYAGSTEFEDDEGYIFRFEIADFKCAACGHIWTSVSDEPDYHEFSKDG